MTNKLKLKLLKGLNSLKEIVLKSIEFQKDLESLPQAYKDEYEAVYNEMYSNSVLRNQLNFRPIYYPTLEQTIKVRVTISPELLSLEDWKGYLNYGIENAQTNTDDIISLPAVNLEGEIVSDGKGFIKIDKIQLSNFRFFVDDEEHNSFELDGQNMLLYGENGSGKSSIFKAFEFLSKVSTKDISEEFKENKNRFNIDKDSNISFEFDNDEILDINDDTTTNNELIFINNLSVFMPILNYQNLLKVSYQEKQESEKNLYDFFETILENYPIDDAKVLKDLKESKDIRYFDIFEKILQDELFDYINMFLNHFNQNFKLIQIDFNKPFKIITLDIEYFDEQVKQYHLFLNEARLSALAMSIYFSIIKAQFRLLGEHSLKILVLDDLLISLDMSNRLTLIEILKNEFSDFQIFLFTHDKGFFEVLKDKMNWKYFEMYVDIDDTSGIEMPYIKTDGQVYENLTRAKEHFKNKDYPASANYLRKEVERLFDEYLQINNLAEKIKLSKLKENEQLIWDIQKDLKKLLRVLEQFENCEQMPQTIQAQKCREFSEQVATTIESTQKYINEDFHFEEFEDVKMVLKNILNPQSHNDFRRPLYKRELENAIELVEAFNQLLIDE